MRTIIAATLCVALSGCQTMSEVGDAVSAANATLTRMAGTNIPVACGIIATAEGYFEILAPNISQANKAKYIKAKAVVAVICNRPPANVLQAITTLASA